MGVQTEKALDLIWEVSEIARFIGRTERQTFHMLASGKIPAKKIGSRWVAERRALERFFSMEAA
jgi:hypothetical protein